MTLTSQIDSPNSPFMQFAHRSIPNPGAVTAIRDGVHRPAVKTKSSHTGTRPDWGLIGTAIDFRLRLAFTSTDLVPPSAQQGYAALTRSHHDSAGLLAELTAATTAVLAEVEPFTVDGIELPESLENDLIRLCVVAGQLDQLYHAYPFVIDKTPLLDGGKVVELDAARAHVPWFVVDQIHDQVRLANVGLGPLRAGAVRASAGMSFSGSALVGGADADLLVDGLLLDFKSTHGATTITRSEVYQLAGYTLLDFDDVHGIEQVGVYWTRHGVMRTFTLATFFALLGTTAPISELRAELRAELTDYENRRLRAYLDRQTARDHIEDLEHLQPDTDTRLRRSIRWLRSALRR